MQSSLDIASQKDFSSPINCIVLLGPTAVGKTALAVRLAYRFALEIISADSRQVYKGLDIGSGKDLGEYIFNGKSIPYHLIDITTLQEEYSVFSFQKDFYRLFLDFKEQGKTSFVVGGTGLYLDSILRGYNLISMPENKELQKELEEKPLEELSSLLLKLKPDLHTKSCLYIKERAIKAIQLELYKKSEEGKKQAENLLRYPTITPLVIGTTLARNILYKNIGLRLSQRIKEGMIEEVEALHKEFSWDRLEKLGLEYKYVSFYLEGKISSKEEMQEILFKEIRHFAKRQETWFRGMEKKGIKINWLPEEPEIEPRFQAATDLIEKSLCFK